MKDDRPAFREHLRELKQASEHAATELGLTVKGGGTIHVELRCVPVLDARRKTRLFRSTLTDITVRNQVQQALRNSEARLTAKNGKEAATKKRLSPGRNPTLRHS